MFAAADFVKLVQEQDLPVGEVVQPLPVEHDALPHLRHPIANLEKLVQLLRVLDEQEPAFGIPEQERDLLGGVGRVDAGDDAAHALDAEIRVDPFLAVLGEYRDHLPPLQPQGGEAEADRTRGIEKFGPGIALPDAEMLFAVGRAPRQRSAAVKEQLGKGVAAIHETGLFADFGVSAVRPCIRCLAGKTAHSRPHDLQVLRRFQRLSPRGLAVCAPR